MSIATLILGKSGTGKSTSLRNLVPAETLLLQVIRKPLPFRSTGWSYWDKDNNPTGNIFVSERWDTIINIGGRQDEIDNSSCDVPESMKFETEEPTFLRFAEVSPVLAHQPHAAVAERMADGDRLGVNQVEFWLTAKQRRAGEEQVADQVIQCV